MAAKVQCQGRLCDPSTKFYPPGANGAPNTSQPVRYGEKACPAFCVPGATDPLCKGCSGKKEKYNAAVAAKVFPKYTDAVYHGMRNQPLTHWSHIRTPGIAHSEWNAAASAKHQLAQLKSAATAAGGGAAVKAVVKKAATVVEAAEKTKAAAVATIQRAEEREDRALTSAAANIVSRMRERLFANAAARPSVLPTLPGASAERAFVAPRRASAAASRRRSTSSSERRRRATRRSSGSQRPQPGTNRTASPSLFSSPNAGNMSNWSTEGPAEDPRLRRRDLVTGRALTPERVALPPPGRYKLPPVYQPRINSVD